MSGHFSLSGVFVPLDDFCFQHSFSCFSFFSGFFFLQSQKLYSSSLKVSPFDCLMVFISITNFVGLTSSWEGLGAWPCVIFLTSLSFWGMSFFPFLFLCGGFFSSCFSPGGIPLVLCVFLFLIELTSTFIRCITLGMRLMANILGGHLFCELSEASNLGLSLLLIYESFVSFMQGFIFSRLAQLYFEEGKVSLLTVSL